MTENTAFRSIRRWFSKEEENSLGNADALTRLYEETHLKVFRYIFGLSGGPSQQAEDLTAETYTRAWKTRHTLKGNHQAAPGWVLRISRSRSSPTWGPDAFGRPWPPIQDGAELSDISPVNFFREIAIQIVIKITDFHIDQLT